MFIRKCLVFIFLLLLFPVSSALPQTPAPEKTKTLTLAVLSLQMKGVSPIEGLLISDKLRSEITRLIPNTTRVKVHYYLATREEMDTAFKQFGYKYKDCDSDFCAGELGKMLQADQVIIGTAYLFDHSYSLIIRLVDVNQKKTIRTAGWQYKGPLETMLGSVVPSLAQQVMTGENAIPSVPVSSPITAAPENPNISLLSVKGTPENAEIYLDGERIGIAPMQDNIVSVGIHTIKVTRKGYSEYEEKVTVVHEKPAVITYKLSSNEGSLTVKGSPEGAVVWIQGVVVGTTPLIDCTMPYGTYSMKITKENYDDYAKVIILEPDKPVEIAYSLTSTLEKISVHGTPDGSSVFIEGREIGRTPLDNYPCPYGLHTVTITKAGYEDFTERVTMERGTPLTITYTLVPKTRASVIKKSLIFPGSGQSYAGYTRRGKVITVIQAITVTGALVASLNSSGALNDYDSAQRDYHNALTQPNIDRTYAGMLDTYDTADNAHQRQIVMIETAMAVYVYNILDALLTKPKGYVKTQDNSLTIVPTAGHGSIRMFCAIMF